MLRSSRFTTAHYVCHFRRDCRGRFLNCQKICHGVHGYPGELPLPIPFPCVASRLSRFAHGCLKRGRRDRREHSVNAVLYSKLHTLSVSPSHFYYGAAPCPFSPAPCPFSQRHALFLSLHSVPYILVKSLSKLDKK